MNLDFRKRYRTLDTTKSIRGGGEECDDAQRGNPDNSDRFVEMANDGVRNVSVPVHCD